MAEIRSRLQDNEDLEHLPEVLIHGAVCLKDGIPDDIFEYVRRRVNWDGRRRFPLVADYDGFSFHSPVHNPIETGDMTASFDYLDDEQTSLNMKSMVKRDIRRRHNRLVCADPPGNTLCHLRTYDEMFRALTGALKALRAMYSVGYLHRKISNNNIILSGDGSKGILIDFERVKKYSEADLPQAKNHDRETDLRQFMSVEVDLPEEWFSFIPDPYPPKFPPRTPSLEEHERTSQLPDWFYNPIHDMESIWWVAVWATLFFMETGKLNAEAWYSYYRLFPRAHYHSKLTRHHVMRMKEVYQVEYRQPFFASYLGALRNCLQYAHTTLQSDLSPVKNRPIYQQTFEWFLKKMEEMTAALGPLGKRTLTALHGLESGPEDDSMEEDLTE